MRLTPVIRRRPLASLAIIVIVALTVGASVAVGTVLHKLWFQRAPFPEGDRLHVLAAGGPSWSPSMLAAFETANTTFDLVTGVTERGVTLTGHGRPSIVRLEGVSAAYFPMLGIGLDAGRAWTAAEERDGSARSAVISRRLADRLFGSPDRALGRRIALDGVPLDVGGVAEARIHGLIGRTDVWLPLRFSRTIGLDPGAPERPWSRWFEVIGRVPPGMDPAQAAATFDVELRRAMGTLPNPETALGARWRPSMVALQDRLGDPALKPSVTLLAAGTALVLLLAAANLCVLQMLDVWRRRREFTIRLAIGATRRQVISHVAGEAVLLAGLGSGLGLGIASWIIELLKRAAPVPAGTFGLRSAVLLSSVTPNALSLALAALCAGIATLALAAPAIWMVRSRLQGVAGDLTATRRPRGAGMLVALELALSVTLVAGAGRLAMSAHNLWSQDRGFDLQGVTVASLELPARRYPDTRVGLLYEQIIERLEAMPGVEAASVTNCVPGSGRCRRTNIARVDGQAPEPHAAPTVGVNFVTGDHFGLLRVPLVRGRQFDARDVQGSKVIVISETAARQLWPGQDPIGRRLALFFASGANTEDREVVGVVRDIAFDRTEADRKPDVYVPSAQMGWPSAQVFIRYAGRPAGSDGLEAALAAIDPDIAISEVATLEARIGRGFQIERLLSRTLVVFSAAALLLTTTGVYVVLAHLVASARREIAIRIALGATPRRLSGWIAQQFSWTLVVGGCAGAIGAGTTGRLLARFLYNVEPTDPAFVMSAAVLVLLTAALSMIPPLRDALSTDPTDVMKTIA